MHFLQYYSLSFNCENQYVKLINLELYEVSERFWRDKVYCQCVIVVLVHAGKSLNTCEKMPAREQIGKEVRSTAKSIVVDVLKQAVLSLSKEIVLKKCCNSQSQM